MFSFVLVFYGVAGHCIQTAVKMAKKGKKSEDQAPASALEPKGRDRAHASSACKARVALAAMLHPLRRGFSEQLRALEHTACDWANIGLCSSALPAIERTPDLAAH